nr:hypothetical protein [Tanacetum cinerariifolium]
DEEDVGVEADFSTLETNISVSPIPNTRVHKDHHVTQIISELTSAPRIRSMARMVKEQGFKDLDYPDKVYKVVKALYGLHQAPRAWYETLTNYLLENELCKAFEKLMKDKFQMSSMGELTFFLGLQVKQKEDGIFISQDKYVAKILGKFGLTDEKSASTPIDTEKPLLKDPDGEDVDVHIYRSMIGSLMYLTSSRPDIMFAVCACARFQVTPKASHLHAVKRIFSDYAGASLDRKSITGGCQFLGCRLISWQCKKQTVVATSLTKAEYVATVSCCAQVLWIQNQLLDYGHFITVVSYKLMLFNLTKDAAVHLMLLDDADGVECLPNEEIFIELARMGYEKPPPKLTFHKPGTNSVVLWPRLSSALPQVESLISLILINNQVDDPSSYTIKYTSPALTQKVFANMRRIEPITTPPQAQPAPPSSPLQEQPIDTSMTHLHTLIETCATLSQKVAHLEQDKITHKLEIIKLKQRRMHLNDGRIEAIDADEDITLVYMETKVDLDAELQGRIKRKDDDNAAAN